MRVRNVFGVLLCVILAPLAAGSGLALQTQPTRPPEAVGAGTAPGAHAPWFTETVDSTGDVGQYASVSAGPHPPHHRLSVATRQIPERGAA
jgi:hypothetical protein